MASAPGAVPSKTPDQIRGEKPTDQWGTAKWAGLAISLGSLVVLALQLAPTFDSTLDTGKVRDLTGVDAAALTIGALAGTVGGRVLWGMASSRLEKREALEKEAVAEERFRDERGQKKALLRRAEVAETTLAGEAGRTARTTSRAVATETAAGAARTTAAVAAERTAAANQLAAALAPLRNDLIAAVARENELKQEKKQDTRLLEGFILVSTPEGAFNIKSGATASERLREVNRFLDTYKGTGKHDNLYMRTMLTALRVQNNLFMEVGEEVSQLKARLAGVPLPADLMASTPDEIEAINKLTENADYSSRAADLHALTDVLDALEVAEQVRSQWTDALRTESAESKAAQETAYRAQQQQAPGSPGRPGRPETAANYRLISTRPMPPLAVQPSGQIPSSEGWGKVLVGVGAVTLLATLADWGWLLGPHLGVRKGSCPI